MAIATATVTDSSIFWHSCHSSNAPSQGHNPTKTKTKTKIKQNKKVGKSNVR